MASNSDIVTAFIDAWATKDVDSIMEFFTEDAVYTNIPIDPPNKGKAEIRAFIEGFIGMANEVEFVVHHQIESADGVVMNERTDRFKIGDKGVDLGVMGVFELVGGKISGWRDYFDLEQFSSQMTAAIEQG